MVNLSEWSNDQLLNALWMIRECNATPPGGLPMEWYAEELYKRDSETKLYHEDLTVADILKR